jgi:N-acetylmuramoyl-L-alanine amidase
MEQKRLGIDVYMTRRTDTLIARDDRGTIANAQKGDLFLSIHTNAANPNWKNASGARGFETYFLSTARTEDERRVAAMENDVVRFEAPVAAAGKDDPLSFILADLAQNEHLRESSDFATTIQSKLAETHPGPNRGVKQAGFAVLARAFMPAVLVEIGFGTNKAEAAWMASSAGQQAAAESLAEATLEYLKHYDRRTRASQR